MTFASPYVDFRASATTAGIAPEIVSILSDGYRDSQEHNWTGSALEWCGNPQQLIERAIEAPERIAAVCAYFFASDGLRYLEGIRHLDKATVQLAEEVISYGWIEEDSGPPYFVKAADTRLGYLKSPRSSKDVKKFGYGFTHKLDEAWPFPSRKQALAKSRVVNHHMGVPFCTIPVPSSKSAVALESLGPSNE